MVMSLIAIGLVAAVAYVWVMAGFFSGAIHMVCVLVAGAIAFAFWEQGAYLILDNVAGNKGFFSFLPGMAWGVALVVPFCVSLAILRLATNKAIIANVTLDNVVDKIGGGVCGLVSGVVTSGIVMIAFGALWGSTQSAWAFQRLDGDANGRFQSANKLIFPVDDIVASAYGGMSDTTLSTEYSLARMYPNLADVPSAMRQTLFDGKGRPTMASKEFKVLGGYIVGADESFTSALESQASVQAVIGSSANPFKPVTDRNGKRMDVPGNYIVGYAMSFESSARERGSSQVVFGSAQLRLVCEDAQGDTKEFFPFAFITRADQSDVVYLRYDFLDGDFPATFAENSPKMGFEFFVPGGYKPRWLYVKNTRVDVGDLAYEPLTPAQRATRLDDKSLVEMTRREFDYSQAIIVRTGTNTRGIGISVINFLPLSMIIQDGNQGALKLDEAKKIVSGRQDFIPGDLDQRGLDRALRVNELDVARFSALVQIQVTASNRVPTPAVDLTEPPLTSAPSDEPIFLIDDEGYAFAAIGYAYKDRLVHVIRYTRSDVLTGLEELPSVPSRSRRDQEIVLIFEVQNNKRIEGIAIGDTVYIKFDPPIEVKRRR